MTERENTKRRQAAIEPFENLRMLSEQQVADCWGLARVTLRYWRKVGGGPPWCRLGGEHSGPIRYPVEQLRAWIAEKIEKAG